MVQSRPYCLSIAGFDPCGGAGVLADCKTFEQFQVYGLGVLSAQTYQNDHRFDGVSWCSFEEIKKQLEPLTVYPVKTVKIGLVENALTLQKLTRWLKIKLTDCFIIWDPVLKASAGHPFHENETFNDALTNIDLITPNYPEFQALRLHKTDRAYLLKGGHRDAKRGTDTLVYQHQEIEISGDAYHQSVQKHGTGCVLSSAIAAEIAKGSSLPKACELAKRYTEKLLLSNTSNLGYHA